MSESLMVFMVVVREESKGNDSEYVFKAKAKVSDTSSKRSQGQRVWM